MKYFSINPSAKLAGLVRFFWVLEMDNFSGAPYIHRTMADGCVEMVFHYQGVFDELLGNDQQITSFSSGISGPSQQFRRFSIDQRFGIFGVYLYPFAMSELFDIPCIALTNEMIDMTTILGTAGKELQEKMMLAPDNQTRVTIISQFLESRLARRKTKHHSISETIRQIISTDGSSNVQRLAEDSFLSMRQFQRNFKEYAGFSPKLFTRIIRFQTALRKYPEKESLSLTDIAYDCGYYDQSHFIHDFKEFSGHHPGTYFSGKAEATKWITV
jgi:AraC-like DNA-binding protein